ncbi:hypothetical protein BH09PAT1_BH09PAT1_5910 [soil metagenome]
MDAQPNNEGNSHEEKEALIDQIRQQDKGAFTTWIADHSPRETLEIPHEALRVLIPKRIFELADNPEKVDVISEWNNRPTMLDAMIVEKKHKASRHTLPQ